MRMTSLMFLLPLAQGQKIVGIASKRPNLGPPFELDFVDQLTGQYTKLADLGTDGAPVANCGVLRDSNTVVYCTVFSSPDPNYGCLTTADLSTGKIEVGQRYPLWFNNIGFDKVTNQTFVNALNVKASTNYVFEVRDQLREVIQLPAPIPAGLSAYSSSKRIFFLTQIPGPSYHTFFVLAVSTEGEQGKILYNVSVTFTIRSMVYDDTFGVLYAWGADSTRSAMLVSVDYTTGKILKTFFQSSSALSVSGATAAINKEGTIMYSSLLNAQNRTVIHALDLNSGNATLAPTDLFLLSMNFQ